MKNIAQKNSNYKVGHILVVDDEAELMSALCEMLAGQGYETEGFTSGTALHKLLGGMSHLYWQRGQLYNEQTA